MGRKRIDSINPTAGFMTGVGFLERNGLDFFATEADAVTQTLGLAAGAVTQQDYAAWLTKWSVTRTAETS